MERTKEIEQILEGIDSCDSDEAWWETSTGAEYGKIKLEEVISVVKEIEVEIFTLQAKYDKLKEAFNSLLQSSVATRFEDSYGLNAAVGMGKYKERWLNRAGLEP